MTAFQVRAVLIAVVLIPAAWVFVRYIPFRAESYLFWASVFLALAGVLSLIRPLSSLHIRSRRTAALFVIAGISTAGLTLLWPVSAQSSTHERSAMDDFLPEYHFHEYHSAEIAAAPERVYQAVREATFADIGGLNLLMTLRAIGGGNFRILRLPASAPIIASITGPGGGFFMLAEVQGREVVVGMVGRPWSASSPRPNVFDAAGFQAFHDHGSVKAVMNIRVVPTSAGRSILSTETRILCVDDAGLRTFSRYWTVIYPGSSIIRRMMLDGIAARALL